MLGKKDSLTVYADVERDIAHLPNLIQEDYAKHFPNLDFSKLPEKIRKSFKDRAMRGQLTVGVILAELCQEQYTALKVEEMLGIDMLEADMRVCALAALFHRALSERRIGLQEEVRNIEQSETAH